jgi:hypothetical protein
MLRATAFCFVVGLPVLGVFDRFSPWPPAIDALSAYSGQSRVCVGYSTDHEWTSTASHSSVQRSYLLFPRALSSPSIISVTVTDGSAAVVTESRFGLWFFVAIYVSALFYCLRLLRVWSAKRHAQSTADT